MTYLNDKPTPFPKPPRWAIAAEWLAQGWEWRDRAWWKYEVETRTWHRVTGADAQPSAEVIKSAKDGQD
jgi:hypothetical protein